MRSRDHEVEAAARLDRDVERAIGEDVRLDPCEQPEGPVALAVQPIDLDALAGEARRRQAVGDRQPGGMIGDRRELVAAGATRGDDVLEGLAAVAPRRVHLQITAIVGERRPGEAGVVERGPDAGPAQEMAAEGAAARDLGALAARVDRGLDDRRSAGAQHLEDDARRRRPDARDRAPACRPAWTSVAIGASRASTACAACL